MTQIFWNSERHKKNHGLRTVINLKDGGTLSYCIECLREQYDT